MQQARQCVTNETIRHIQPFVDLVEALRQRRQADSGAGGRGFRYTQHELAHLTLSRYLNMLRGRPANLPTRDEVEAVADYLGCSQAEHAQLLIAAGHYVEPTWCVPGHPAWPRAFAALHACGAALPYPWLIYQREGTIYAANDALLELLGLSRQLFEMQPVDLCNLLVWAATEQGLLARCLSHHPTSQAAARRFVLWQFWQATHTAQQTVWYRDRVTKLEALLPLAQLLASLLASAGPEPSAVLYLRSVSGEIWPVRLALCHSTPGAYPALLLFVPVDGATHGNV